MSSYNQVTEERTLAETLSLAVIEVRALDEEMSDLCASISAQFPGRFERIDKYQEALRASEALGEARTLLGEEPLSNISPNNRNVPVTATVGKQTRQNRPTSQRVRLGNAVVRLQAVVQALAPGRGGDEQAALEIEAAIDTVDGITFPTRFG